MRRAVLSFMDFPASEYLRKHTAVFWLALLAGALLPLQVRAAPLQQVHDSVHTIISRLKPAGRLNGSQQLHLAVSLPVRNPQGLAQFLAQVQDPASPNYRKYLTPAQFTERFGPSKRDYEAVETFAKAHRLKVTATHPNRLVLDLTGAVSDIERTLHVTMRTYRHPREARDFYAADAEPALDLATPVMQISGLNDYELPHSRLQIKPAAPAGGARANSAPNAGSAPNGCYMGNDFRTAYVPGTSLTGNGQTVGLVQFDGYSTGDITYYESLAGRSNVSLTNVPLDGFSGAPTGNGG